MKNLLILFMSGFAQVFFVSANIYFISRTAWLGIAVCGFGISLLWTINVKRVSCGNKTEQIVYAAGAMLGGLAGVLMAKLLKH